MHARLRHQILGRAGHEARQQDASAGMGGEKTAAIFREAKPAQSQ